MRDMRWNVLPRVRPYEVALSRLACAFLPGEAERGAMHLARVLGSSSGFKAGAPFGFPSAELEKQLRQKPFVGLVIRSTDRAKFAVIVDGALAGRLAARSLGASEPELLARRTATAAEREALAGLATLVLDARGAKDLVVDEVIEEVAPLLAALGEQWIVASDVLFSIGDAKGILRVLVPEGSLAAYEVTRCRSRRLAHLLVVLGLVRGRGRLAASDVRALAHGDVVILDDGQEGWLELGRGGFRVEIGADALTIASEYQQGEAMASDFVSEVSIDLSCRLAEVSMTVGELDLLAPGAILPLGKPLGSRVDLVTHGQVVARGELVDIDGELGMRVLEVPALAPPLR